jgi:Domain of unknown function (DUF222)
MSTPSELRAVARISTAVSQLADVDLGQLPDPSLLELARQVRQLVCRLQSVEIQLVAAIDGRGATITDGLKATTTWLRSQLRVSDAVARLRCANAVTTMPVVAKAFSSGELSLEHVTAIARIWLDAETEGRSDAVEQLLVDEARMMAPARFAQAAARICDQVVSNHGRELVNQRRGVPRWLNIRRTVDGAVAVSGRFDREAGDDVIEAVEALAAVAGNGDARPAARRRADALLVLCRQAVSHPSTAQSSRARVGGQAVVDRDVVGTRGTADVERDKPVRPGGRRRLKRRVKRRARR